MEGVITRSELVAFRDGIEADYPFIYATFLKGLRHGNDHYGLIESAAYYKHQHDKIEEILNDFEVTVKVACLKDDPEVLLGYCIYKGARLDFVFIKKSWRGIGLARDLVPQDISTVTHITKVGLSLLRKRPQITYNPYA